MIIFDGVDLEEIVPVKIEDIRVNPIQIEPIARQRFGFGQKLIRVSGISRRVSITFALPNEILEERAKQILDDITEWAQPFKVCPLSLPMYNDRHLDVMCVSYPQPSYRQWWESKLRLEFETFDNPYWTSDNEIRAQCGSPFTINGTAIPLVRIERNLGQKVANQTYSCNGKSMLFEQIPAGKLTIDLNDQIAEVSGASIMKYFSKTSRFIEPATGNLLISGNGVIIYRERWI